MKCSARTRAVLMQAHDHIATAGQLLETERTRLQELAGPTPAFVEDIHDIQVELKDQLTVIRSILGV